MKKQTNLTPEAFEQLLDWLDSEREKAGLKYEDIRLRLIRIFSWRGVNCAEELADDTINRVLSKIATVTPSYSGDPALYFYGVAQNIFLEYTKRKLELPLPPALQPAEQDDVDYSCLDGCLEQLDPETRWLVIEYYREDKQAKIAHRKWLAEQLGINTHTLRMRAHRIKAILKKCIIKCREQLASGL
jgi:DNA-directed RNA polymerase specialized sigma24 family protein